MNDETSDQTDQQPRIHYVTVPTPVGPGVQTVPIPVDVRAGDTIVLQYYISDAKPMYPMRLMSNESTPEDTAS